MGSAQQREFGVRPSKRESQMKGRGLVLHEPTRPWAALSLPTAGCRDRAGGPPVGSLRTSGSQATHQQTGVAVGPHPWGVRGLSQAWLQAVGLGNPGWVLWCLSWSLLGRQIHMGTHTHRHMYTHRDRCHVQIWTHLSEHKRGLRPKVVIRHLGPLFPSPGTLAAPLKKPQPHPTPPPNGSTENKQAQPS